MATYYPEQQGQFSEAGKASQQYAPSGAYNNYNPAPQGQAAGYYAAPPTGQAPYYGGAPQTQPQGYYAPPPSGPPPPMGQYQEPAMGGEKVADNSNGRFKPKRKIRDPIPLILFIITVLGFAALSGIVLNNYSKYNGLGGGFGNASQGGTGTSITLDRQTVYMFLLVAALAFLLSALYLVVSSG